MEYSPYLFISIKTCKQIREINYLYSFDDRQNFRMYVFSTGSKFYSRLCFDTLLAKGMFDKGHFGDEIGNIDQTLRCAPSR
jgi:hypothetical protein